MNNNLIGQLQVEEDNKVMIEANQYYDIIPEATVVIQNTSEAVNYENMPSNAVSQNVLNFKVKLNQNFLDRGVTIQFPKIPIVATRATATNDGATPTPAPVTVDSTNFMTDFFDNFSNFCMAEYGILNAIDSIRLNLDGFTLSVSDVPEKLKVLSQYYSEDDIHKYFPNSLPDVYNSYDLVDYANPVGINKANLLRSKAAMSSSEFWLKRPNLPDFNPFTSSLEEKYTTRIPNVLFKSATPTTCSFSLVDQSIHLPFTLFSIPGDKLPLYNVDTIDLTITLKSNWEQYIFALKTSTLLINAVKYDTSGVIDFNPHINYRTFTAPNYIREQMSKDKAFAMNYANIIIDSSVKEVSISALSSTKVTTQQYTVTQIPKKIICYAIPKIISADSEALTKPNYFARIESLQVKIGGVTTNVAVDNSLSLYNLCKTNGLNTSKECALYSKGFPILLNVTDDLGCKSNSLVSGTDGHNTVDIVATITNLNCANLNTTYVFKTMFINDSIFEYNPQQKRVQIVDSILPNDDRSMKMHTSNLYSKNMQRMNLLGAGFFSSIGEYAAKFGKGALNVIKAIATNKDGFRDELVKKYQGGQVIYGHGSNVTGGASFDNHLPIGGRSIANWSEK